MSFSSGKSRSVVLGALAAASTLAGCGGSGDAPVPPPRPDPVQAYREVVGRQCLDARLDREIVPSPGGSDAQNLAAYLEATLAAARRSERRLKRIAPPPAVAEQHRRGRRLGREAIGLVDRAARAARSGEAPNEVLRRLQPALNRRIEAGNRIAAQLGTEPCLQEPLDLQFTP